MPIALQTLRTANINFDPSAWQTAEQLRTLSEADLKVYARKLHDALAGPLQTVATETEFDSNEFGQPTVDPNKAVASMHLRDTLVAVHYYYWDTVAALSEALGTRNVGKFPLRLENPYAYGFLRNTCQDLQTYSHQLRHSYLRMAYFVYMTENEYQQHE